MTALGASAGLIEPPMLRATPRDPALRKTARSFAANNFFSEIPLQKTGIVA
jgi:hypothetical protein